MAGKLSIVIVVILFVCSVQASLERFGDLGKGELGYYRRCFLKWSFGNLIAGFYQHPVEELLGNDREEVENELDKKFSGFGGHEKCSEGCYEWLVPQVKATRSQEDDDLNNSRCERYAKFNRLCELIKEKRTGDLNKFAIERWLCKTAMALKEPLYSSFFVCQLDKNYPKTYRLAAEQMFDSVFAYSKEQLEEAIKSSEAEIEASEKLRAELDDKVTEKVYSMVNNGSEKIQEYMKCSKQEKKDLKRERKEERRREREDDNDYEDDDEDSHHSDEMAMLGIMALAAL